MDLIFKNLNDLEGYTQYAGEMTELNRAIEIIDGVAYGLLESEVVIDGEIVDISETQQYKEKKEQEEKQRIANLKMTPQDFLITLENFGVSFENQIEPLLATNWQARRALNYCNHVYRGNPLLDTLCGTFGVTSEQLDAAFETFGG